MKYLIALLLLASCAHTFQWVPNGEHGSTKNLNQARAYCMAQRLNQRQIHTCMAGEGWVDTNSDYTD